MLIQMEPGGGWIYVLMTPNDYNRVKVGMTKNNPLLRLRELRTGDPSLSLLVAYYIPPGTGLSLRDIESLIHKDFEHVRIHFINDEDQIRKPSEWFKIDCNDAEYYVDGVFKLNGYTVTEDKSLLLSKPVSDPDVGRFVIKYYESDLGYDPCEFASSLLANR